MLTEEEIAMCESAKGASREHMDYLVEYNLSITDTQRKVEFFKTCYEINREYINSKNGLRLVDEVGELTGVNKKNKCSIEGYRPFNLNEIQSMVGKTFLIRHRQSLSEPVQKVTLESFREDDEGVVEVCLFDKEHSSNFYIDLNCFCECLTFEDGSPAGVRVE